MSEKIMSPFMVDPSAVMDAYGLTDDDFTPAAEEEKVNMVEKRKSVSYWQDAWRRFRANTVSMAALFVFILCLIFAFLGPKFTVYDYEAQYRSSQKLGPMEYSEDEQMIQKLEPYCERMWATALQPGSMTSLAKGNYYIEYKGETYAFTLEKKLKKAAILLDPDAENPLISVKEDDITDEGYSDFTVIEYTDTPADDAEKLKMVRGVSPHFFGTDSVGRDLMARTMYGARVSIIIGISAAIIVLIIGSIYGAVSGIFGGAVDFIMMRLVELIYSIPEVLIVLLLQVVLKDPLQQWFDAGESALARSMSDLGTGIVSILITFGLLYWVTMARIVRGQVLQLRKQEYIMATEALGASKWRIIKRHLLPNCVGALVITTCLQIPSAIFLESFLSFLGLGVSAPMASLGSLCSDALQTITLYPYRLVYPAVVLTIIVLSLNLVGDGLRDALDPRLKK